MKTRLSLLMVLLFASSAWAANFVPLANKERAQWGLKPGALKQLRQIGDHKVAKEVRRHLRSLSGQVTELRRGGQVSKGQRSLMFVIGDAVVSGKGGGERTQVVLVSKDAKNRPLMRLLTVELSNTKAPTIKFERSVSFPLPDTKLQGTANSQFEGMPWYNSSAVFVAKDGKHSYRFNAENDVSRAASNVLTNVAEALQGKTVALQTNFFLRFFNIDAATPQMGNLVGRVELPSGSSIIPLASADWAAFEVLKRQGSVTGLAINSPKELDSIVS
ncbi:MAG: hypothetical protein KDA51_09300, partial [Planctomycetales bacterium]|nr:hypothetical protein [Planctomycetales bacterium]